MTAGAALPATGPFDPRLAAWSAWRPEDVATRLAGVACPWYVAAGWALELFLGSSYREHEDLEIGMPADRFSEVATALPDVEFHVVGSGVATPLAEAGALLQTHHQTWALERAAGLWRLDVFREPADGATWICRRDPRLRLAYDDLIEWTSDGIPYARPEIVLLFKAQAARPKDEDDFAAVLPRLDPERRRRLAGMLASVHPGHRWLEALA